MGKLKFSIIIPSYNQADFLEECIRSVLEQSYPNWELIVIDGGSSDSSVEIIEKYADRIAYWQSERDRGQTNAINIGFGHATGDIVTWLNSDDRYTRTAFEQVAEVFAREPGLDLVFGDQGIIDAEGERTNVIHAAPYFPHVVKFGGAGFPQPSTFFTKGVLDGAGELKEDLVYQMDTELFLRFVKRGCRYQHIPSLLADFRVHGASKTGGTDRAIFMEENFNLRKEFLPGFLGYPWVLDVMKWTTRVEAYLLRTFTRGFHMPFKGTVK